MSEETLQIIEIFKSIQGETTFTGLPTTFVRLAACNLRCTWCDTTYSFGRGETWPLEKIFSTVTSYGCRHVCVTGGEPLLQKNVYHLMKELCDRGYCLSLETGGSLPIDQVDPRVHLIVDVKCPGSGMEKKNEWANLSKLRSKDEVKFVISDRNDFDYAKEVCEKYSLYEQVGQVLFAPAFDILHPQLLVEWILSENLRVRLNLQMHKFIWDPSTKGV